jgi:hypothetical protein
VSVSRDVHDHVSIEQRGFVPPEVFAFDGEPLQGAQGLRHTAAPSTTHVCRPRACHSSSVTGRLEYQRVRVSRQRLGPLGIIDNCQNPVRQIPQPVPLWFVLRSPRFNLECQSWNRTLLHA